ncbi:tetratricopeptide repeat protein [Geobacter sp.]|uniref:tetratricopeptide repeat protein n=1 Tax=Geobacter sp. TaxID=46610 RepID=UPI0027B92157|nr:tetratricopeptide repeat protein [Geobacter sp.]
MKKLRRLGKDAKCILPGVTVLLLLAGTPGTGADDSRLFTTGFEAFSGGDSKGATRALSHLLEVYPGTKLRELALFYLARAHFRTGNQEEAAQAMARLLQEYPGTSLTDKAEKELLGLVARYRRGEKLSRGDDDLDVLPVGELAAVSAAPEYGRASVAAEKAVHEKAERSLAVQREKRVRANAPTRPAPTASSSLRGASGAGAEFSGPLLRAVVKPDKTDLYPGEQVEYLVTLLNVGSGRAEGIALRLMFPDGEYEPVDFAKGGFRNEGGGALVLDNVSIGPGQVLEYPVVFRVKNDAGIGQELRCSVRLLSGAIGTWDSYRSKASFVSPPRRP